MSHPSSGGSSDELVFQLQHALGQAPPGLVSAYLFGSQAEGREHRESDVDLGVYFDYQRHPTSRSRFEAHLDLTRVLGPALGRNDCDIVVLNDAPPQFSRHIVRSGRRVYCSDEEADRAFHRTVLSRAADLEPFLRRARQRILAELAR